MKAKSSLLIACKVMVVGALIWYLPTKVVESSNVIEASTLDSNSQQVATPVNSKDKKIYIYNTHQSEAYDGYNVIEGANYLKDCLVALGYFCDVEANNFEQYKTLNNIAYNNSYSVSKMYLEQNLSTNGSYDLIIDFHRDSVDKNLSTISYNNTSYAKIMFVVGETSGNYDKVNQMSKSLSDKVDAIVPGISRGVYVKQSHYNQGISENMVLIEMGAQGNTKEEIENTAKVLASVIDQYLGG